MIRTRRILSATLFARALFALTLLSAVGACARQGEPIKDAKEVREAREAFAKLGATYEGPADYKPRSRPLFVYDRWEPPARPTVHVFRMPPATEDRDLKVLPNPPFAFELSLSGTRVTDAGLKELAPLRNLTTLHLPGTVTDATLRALREAGLLYALPQAWERFGGRPRPTKPGEVMWLNLSGTKVTDAGLKELAPLINLTALYLGDTRVTDAGLKELATLKSLRTLHLPGTVTGAGLKELAPLQSLTTLDLRGTGVTDAGLKELAALQNLTTLSLHDTQVTGAGLKELIALKSLSTLHLPVTDSTLRALREAGLLHILANASGRVGVRPTKHEEITGLGLGAGVSDEGLKEIAQLKNLTRLDLNSPNVTGAGLKELAPLKNLTTLTLSGPATDAGLKGLAPLQSLTTLTLFSTKVTDAGLKELATLKNLTVLDLRDTKVSDKGVETLQQALPKCKISR